MSKWGSLEKCVRSGLKTSSGLLRANLQDGGFDNEPERVRSVSDKWAAFSDNLGHSQRASRVLLLNG
jgi:hypothetical protein